MRGLPIDRNERRSLVASALLLFGAAACEERTPTSLDESLLPPEPVTVEVRLGWDQFASNLEVFGGYGAPEELGTGVLANEYADTLNARTLVRFGAYPTETSVRDSLGTIRTDTNLTFVGGRVVAFFDTIASTNTSPVTLALGATENEWHATTATWTAAVDTIGDLRPWPEPGAGPVTPIGTVDWDPDAGDSVSFSVDSTTIAEWADTTDLSRGMRLDLVTPGHRLQVTTVALRLITRPSLNPDTLVDVTAPRRNLTFVYDPFPEPPPDGIRIGGVPAWRTVLDVGLPAQLTGPPELCAAVGCPLVLESGQVNHAALLLRSRQTETAFQPTDTVRLDVRPVFSRAAMPKSPLGSSLVGLTEGGRVPPDAFGAGAGVEIEVPVTGFVRRLLPGAEEGPEDAPNTLALLSVFEPLSIAFASFHGPGGPDEPVLRLILTVSPSVELP